MFGLVFYMKVLQEGDQLYLCPSSRVMFLSQRFLFLITQLSKNYFKTYKITTLWNFMHHIQSFCDSSPKASICCLFSLNC